MILRLGFLIFAGIAFARLYQLQITYHKPLAAKAARQRQRGLKAQSRGGIYDRNGRELAVSLPVVSAYINPDRFKDYDKLKTVAEILDMEPVQVRAIASGDKSFAWLKRKLSPRQRRSLQDLRMDGVGFTSEKRRFYPKKTLASHLLGIVGTDGVGLEGLEYRFERSLQGNEQGASAGRRDLILTIDESVQYIAQMELNATCRDVYAKAGCVIVMDPNSGDILAMANYPDFNPNSFRLYPVEVRRNRAVTDAYEPGSVMKVFTAAAALEEKVFTPDSEIWCEEGEIEVGGLTIKDTGKFGTLTVSQILKHSSNVGAIKIGLAVGKRRLYKYFRNFGFGVPTGVDFPGESAGILRPTKQWSKVSPAAISIGQEIAVTPLQLSTAMAVVANGGKLLKPRLVRAIRDSKTKKVIKSFLPQLERRVISVVTAKQLRNILIEVVARGTGREAALPNIKVAGKTGTGQKIDPLSGVYSEDKVVASFIGYLPADNPQLVILAMVDEPQSLAWGGRVAAPLFRRVAEQVIPYLKIVPRADILQVAVNN